MVPTKAQIRETRGPVAALLILVGLLFSAGAFSGAGVRDASIRLGPARQGSATSLVRATDSAMLSDEATPEDGTSFVPPAEPRRVVERLALRPSNRVPADTPPTRATRGAASYRARAPPAV